MSLPTTTLITGGSGLEMARMPAEPDAPQRPFEHTQHQGPRIDALANDAGFGVVEEHGTIAAAQPQRRLQLDVAAAGVAPLLGGGLTRMVGLTNRVMVPANRFVPRAMVAAVSKRLLQPLDLRAAPH